jgi:hypothetical protein
VLPSLALAMIKFFTHLRRQYIGNLDSSSNSTRSVSEVLLFLFFQIETLNFHSFCDFQAFEMDTFIDGRRPNEIQDPPVLYYTDDMHLLCRF